MRPPNTNELSGIIDLPPQNLYELIIRIVQSALKTSSIVLWPAPPRLPHDTLTVH